MRRLLRALRERWQRPLLDALAGLRQQQAMDYRQLEALASLLAVLRPRAPLPPFRGWAVGPDFASLLVSLVLRERPACVVELGSGVSTLVLGYALERTGGHLISVDHEAEYAERTRVAVGLHGLAEVATILHAPLEPYGAAQTWYTRQWIRDLPPVHCLVVDGPPGTIGVLARAPAMTECIGALAPGAIIVVDDADRPDEQTMVRTWRMEQPRLTHVGRVDTERGAAVLRWNP